MNHFLHVPQPAQADLFPPLPAQGAGSPLLVRIRFRKEGDLRFISHHDLMRCFERMLRRSHLPFRSTQGYHPKPRLVFALPLPLGIIGCQEMVDLELTREVLPEEIQAQLARQTPAGLEILSVRRIPDRTKVRVSRVRYRVSLPAEQTTALSERVSGLLASRDCWLERTRPRVRRIDLRPFLENVYILPDALEMVLRVLPSGTVRPGEVLHLLGLDPRLGLEGHCERLRLELAD
jgi:radical SAM-linked protein